MGSRSRPIHTRGFGHPLDNSSVAVDTPTKRYPDQSRIFGLGETIAARGNVFEAMAVADCNPATLGDNQVITAPCFL